MRKYMKLWPEALIWLMFLAPLFFISYGQVNNFTATRTDVQVKVFSWEQGIPFIPWSIIPYWSLDLLYGLSLFTCTSRSMLRRLVLRLGLASILACIGFLLFPLRFSFTRPEVTGIAGWLFGQLEQFDLPYNQSPSLHIILCWLLWLHFRPLVRSLWRGLVDLWAVLIALSVLTTWQHHFIDVLTGLGVGVIISWIVPVKERWRWQRVSQNHQNLARLYGGGVILCLGGALWWPFLAWPALALMIIMLAYLGLGVSALQKGTNGELTHSAGLLLIPWRLCMVVSRHLYCRKLPASSPVLLGVSLGCYPRKALQQKAVVDLTSEFSRSRVTKDLGYLAVPMLDLVVPTHQQLEKAVEGLELMRQRYGTVLVHCALGLSRSAVVVIAWMLKYQHASSVDEAVLKIRQSRPQIVLPATHQEYLEKWKVLTASKA